MAITALENEAPKKPIVNSHPINQIGPTMTPESHALIPDLLSSYKVAIPPSAICPRLYRDGSWPSARRVATGSPR